jgi:hypothetical protein
LILSFVRSEKAPCRHKLAMSRRLLKFEAPAGENRLGQRLRAVDRDESRAFTAERLMADWSLTNGSW